MRKNCTQAAMQVCPLGSRILEHGRGMMTPVRVGRWAGRGELEEFFLSRDAGGLDSGRPGGRPLN